MTSHPPMQLAPFHSAPPWQRILIPSQGLPFSTDKLRAVIDELAVERAPRYQPTAQSTFCNIFVADVLQAMGLLPEHRMPSDGSAPAPGLRRTVEQNANMMTRWLSTYGVRHGWIGADRKTATDAAARGHTVVVAWDSQKSSPGHIAVMLTEGTIAQAGRTNFVGKTIREGFGRLEPRFFIHVRPGGHTP